MPERKEFFSTICMVSRAFGTTLEMSALLDLIVQSAIETMNGKAACLFLHDEGKKSPLYFPLAQKGLSRNYLHVEPQEAIRAADVILKKGYLAIHDATKDPRVKHHDLKKAEGIASILVVPVMVKDALIGLLALYTSKARRFSDNEIEFLTALAEQGGMAIQHTRLLEQIRRNTQLFYDLAVNINSSLDIKEVMKILSTNVAKSFGVKGVSVRLLDRDNRTLELVASYGLSRKYLDKGPIDAEKSIAEALSGKAVVVRDASKDSGVQYKKEKLKEGIVSILCVPIKEKEDVIGVLRLYSDVPREFTEDEIKLATIIAHRVAWRSRMPPCTSGSKRTSRT